jgi:hypothetical protein
LTGTRVTSGALKLKKAAIPMGEIYTHRIAIEDGRYLNEGVLVQMEILTLQTRDRGRPGCLEDNRPGSW